MSDISEEMTFLKETIIQKKKELDLLKARGVDKFVPNINLELKGIFRS